MDAAGQPGTAAHRAPTDSLDVIVHHTLVLVGLIVFGCAVLCCVSCPAAAVSARLTLVVSFLEELLQSHDSAVLRALLYHQVCSPLVITLHPSVPSTGRHHAAVDLWMLVTSGWCHCAGGSTHPGRARV